MVTNPQLLSVLRRAGWSSVPSAPGVYWWYFPLTALKRLRIPELCDVAKLRLRRAPDGRVCLYHGMANNLAERVEWHSAQKLTLTCLRSGFLSTFRFTLLALNGFDYLRGTEQIDRYIDGLSVSWQATNTREQAESLERAELQGAYHYPLNIQGNKRTELLEYVRCLKSTRKAYKRQYME